jgi:hypothetical protein
MFFHDEYIQFGAESFMHDSNLEYRVKSLLKTGGLDTWQRLLDSARRACENEDYIKAIIETIAALEVVVYECVYLDDELKGIAKSATKRYINETDLTDMLEIDFRRRFDDYFDQNLIAECRKAITVRNAILHKGLRKIKGEFAKKALADCTILINQIRRLIEELRKKI